MISAWGCAFSYPLSVQKSQYNSNNNSASVSVGQSDLEISDITSADDGDTILSHVIQAISVPQEYANGTIRVSLGIDNTADQVDKIAQQIAKILC